MNVNMWAVSDAGRVRRSNEDRFYVSSEDNLLIVCDGMGGQVAGSLASKLAVETVKDFFVTPLDNRLAQIIQDLDPRLPEHAARLVLAVRMANRRLYNMSQRHAHLRGMGTTVAAVAFANGIAAMVHVGDSRVYRLRRGRLSQLTSDHSWLQELIDDKEIDPNQINDFAKKNVITRALGITPTVKIDVRYERVKAGDCYMLCSDGLHNALGYSDLAKSLQNHAKDFEGTARVLVERAKEADGSDNITVALGKVKDAGSRTVPNFSLAATVGDEPERAIARESKLLKQRYGEPPKSGESWFQRLLPRDGMTIAATVVCTVAVVLVVLVLRAYMTGASDSARTTAERATGFFSQLKERALAGKSSTPSPQVPVPVETDTVRLPAPEIRQSADGESTGGVLMLLYVPDIERARSLHLPDSVKVVGNPIRMGDSPQPAASVVITLTDQEDKVLSEVRSALPPPKP